MVGTQKREEPREQCQKFKIYEPKVQTPIGPKRKNDILLFTKKEYDENNKVKMTIFEYGQPDTKASRSATIRPITSSGIYNCEPEKLLENLGYRRQKGKIGLYKVERGTQGKQKEQGQEQAGNNDFKESEQGQEWIVEVTSFAKGIDNVQYSVEVLEQIKKELNMLLLIHRDKIKLDLVVVDHIYTQSKISYR
ncbi:hypothetical protein AX774_g2258 [Zancudomyces culisetae]|uniref:Mediator of RNA polymerase II transcription subunit 18 n=1 Tax=Zancudomyces culisetae TaxID=1213189 RepID=A0A1R1PTJ1_ZANCU|nr:hypothetical protein AX774_g2258 [Zancudomyces culisetae]|eukprot:OMH84223.1 hypothetical protein AX774_g2258 [Zancudomyces culisetae]